MFLYNMLDFLIHSPCVCLLKCVCSYLSVGKGGDEECAIIYPPNGEFLSVVQDIFLFQTMTVTFPVLFVVLHY